MLAIKPKVQFLTREITSPNGDVVIGLFAISEVNGLPQVKLIAVKPLKKSESSIGNSVILVIAGACANCIPEVIFDCLGLDSEFSYKDFSFFNSQPTRAPAF